MQVSITQPQALLTQTDREHQGFASYVSRNRMTRDMGEIHPLGLIMHHASCPMTTVFEGHSLPSSIQHSQVMVVQKGLFS
jgi:hypothetical protein